MPQTDPTGLDGLRRRLAGTTSGSLSDPSESS